MRGLTETFVNESRRAAEALCAHARTGVREEAFVPSTAMRTLNSHTYKCVRTVTTTTTTMKNLDTVDLLLGLQSLAVGVTFLSADCFWNPVDGVFKDYTFVNETTLDSNHLDPMSQSILMLTGAAMVATGLGPLFHLGPQKDSMGRNDHMLHAFYGQLLWFLVFAAQMRKSSDSNVFNKSMLGFYTGLFFANTFWLLGKVIKHLQLPDFVEHYPASKAHAAVLAANIVYSGLFGLALYLKPHYSEPGKLLSFWKKTNLEDNTKDELVLFLSRLLGGTILTYTLSMLEILAFDRVIERIRHLNKEALLYFLLTDLAMLKIVLFDDSGYPNKRAYVGSIALTLASATAMFVFGPSPIEKKPEPLYRMKGDEPIPVGNGPPGPLAQKEGHYVQKVPDLKAEAQEKKKTK
jgi:hypothetical protein